jgi:hypothetical protein
MNWQDTVRTLVRPAVLAFMGYTSWLLVQRGLYNPEIFELIFVKAWIGLFITGVGEWIVERPLLKIGGKGTTK